MEQELISRIDNALNDIRPHLAADQGDIEIVGVDEHGALKVRWLGTCETCSMNRMTMGSIEHIIMSRIPEISSVEAVNLV